MILLEDYTHRPGLLQGLPLFVRTAICVALLANTLLWHNFLQLAFFILLSLGLGLASRLPLKLLVVRPFTGSLFFGLVLAIPLSLASVTPGPVAFALGSIQFSHTGISSAEILLLRIAACILISTLWTSTSSWSTTLTVLKRYRATELFANCAALSYRFLHIASVTLSEMVTARISRQAGALRKDQARTYAGVGTAILFAKSMAHTEETHAAMRSRGSECIPTLQDRRGVLPRFYLAVGGLAILVALTVGVAHAF
jgi:energy-coupling factor transporter transmembrane protein EcfT